MAQRNGGIDAKETPFQPLHCSRNCCPLHKGTKCTAENLHFLIPTVVATFGGDNGFLFKTAARLNLRLPSQRGRWIFRLCRKRRKRDKPCPIKNGRTHRCASTAVLINLSQTVGNGLDRSALAFPPKESGKNPSTVFDGPPPFRQGRLIYKKSPDGEFRGFFV